MSSGAAQSRGRYSVLYLLFHCGFHDNILWLATAISGSHRQGWCIWLSIINFFIFFSRSTRMVNVTLKTAYAGKEHIFLLNVALLL